MSDLKTNKGTVVCSTCKKSIAESAAIVHDGTGPSLFFCSEHCIDDYMENQAGQYFEADHVPDEDDEENADTDEAQKQIVKQAVKDVVNDEVDDKEGKEVEAEDPAPDQDS